MILISWEQMEKVKQVNYHEHFGEEQKPQKLNLAISKAQAIGSNTFDVSERTPANNLQFSIMTKRQYYALDFCLKPYWNFDKIDSKCLLT